MKQIDKDFLDWVKTISLVVIAITSVIYVFQFADIIEMLKKIVIAVGNR